jgi:hypothetical protein
MEYQLSRRLVSLSGSLGSTIIFSLKVKGLPFKSLLRIMAHKVSFMGGVVYYYLGQDSMLELFVALKESQMAGRTRKCPLYMRGNVWCIFWSSL